MSVAAHRILHKSDSPVLRCLFTTPPVALLLFVGSLALGELYY